MRTQPLHASLFLASRVGLAISETTNAAITAANSRPERRARNLGLLQSTQAGGRIVSPLLAGWMYERSTNMVTKGASTALGPPGALPFLAVGALVAATAPLPLLLRRGSGDAGDKKGL